MRKRLASIRAVLQGGLPLDAEALADIARSLPTIKSVRTIKLIHDLAEATRQFAKRAHLPFEVQYAAAILRLGAERQGGQLLRRTISHGGSRKAGVHHPQLQT